MDQLSARRLARVLRILVTLVFVCNLVTLCFVPWLAGLRGVRLISSAPLNPVPPGEPAAWGYSAVLTVFLLFCGVCTAVLLWQTRRILGTLAAERPFCRENADAMRRAALCCFLIAAAALARTCWGFWFYRSIRPLLTYNALFCPLFLLGGLLCMVISALFRQAAGLKEENDLTI